MHPAVAVVAAVAAAAAAAAEGAAVVGLSPPQCSLAVPSCAADTPAAAVGTSPPNEQLIVRRGSDMHSGAQRIVRWPWLQLRLTAGPEPGLAPGSAPALDPGSPPGPAMMAAGKAWRAGT